MSFHFSVLPVSDDVIILHLGDVIIHSRRFDKLWREVVDEDDDAEDHSEDEKDDSENEVDDDDADQF